MYITTITMLKGFFFFFANLIFAIIARMLSENHLKVLIHQAKSTFMQIMQIILVLLLTYFLPVKKKKKKCFHIVK